ncbi:DUF4861 domain-containing protein [Seonamhaeicola algicola]|uniref:DUF4861 domain-containing protein n=1 Tax=Seonamhaeicola algicola TaxID=1719036 RepID=A0A5C7AFZ3_9FLAO|nr:DUF4861 family protein [Seonamhaeicola algicola]TXE07247.1 DUF4861 domain-containing protein [Seonamhaeicola algicola]
MNIKLNLVTLVSCLISLVLTSCESKNLNSYSITIKNNSNVSRAFETIEIWFEKLDLKLDKGETFEVYNTSGEIIRSQMIDTNLDTVYDYLVFQTTIEAKSTQVYTLQKAKKHNQLTNSISTTYCKFVPERMDDFAWENDIVAFRTYGPECQRLYEKGDPTGLISSGIDCWLKRVDYPIINKWYNNHKKGISYHQDHGEGLDNYHVGTTRGTGGTALICDSTNVLSENFTSWKIITNGPIRTIFELNYKPVDVCGTKASEKKTISIDLKSHFYKCEVSYTSNKQLEKASAGLALHKGKGIVKENKEEGWVSYWEPIDDSFLGTAVITKPNNIFSFDLDTSIDENESLNNVCIHSKLKDNSFTYWAGYGWKKQGEISSADDWYAHLKQTSIKINNPLEITLKRNKI